MRLAPPWRVGRLALSHCVQNLAQLHVSDVQLERSTRNAKKRVWGIG
jgi:hypothetical protein